MGADRRALAAIAAATGVVIAAVVVIVTVGGVTLPAFPSLAAEPDPDIPGSVAYLHDNEEDCVSAVPAGGGEPRRLWCAEDLSGPLEWSEDGVAVRRFATSGPERVVVDPESGEIVERGVVDPGEPPDDGDREERWRREDGVRLDVVRDQSRARLQRIEPDGSTRTLIDVDAAGRYGFSHPQWSPDGRWALVVDSAQRLIVVDAAGEQAWLLAEDAREPAWGPQAR